MAIHAYKYRYIFISSHILKLLRFLVGSIGGLAGYTPAAEPESIFESILEKIYPLNWSIVPLLLHDLEACCFIYKFLGFIDGRTSCVAIAVVLVASLIPKSAIHVASRFLLTSFSLYHVTHNKA